MVRRIVTTSLAFLLVAMLSIGAAASETRGKVHLLTFGLWGGQKVFEQEARKATAVEKRFFRADGTVSVYVNTRRHSAVSLATLRTALNRLGKKMDTRKDIAVLFFTSHGGPDGLGLMLAPEKRYQQLSPARLKGWLAEAGIERRVLILSACYSGIFANQLADDQTLVITAAAHDRSSFGCSDNNQDGYTYFGKALFGEAMRQETTLQKAFHRAAAAVMLREMREGLTPSMPQMKGGQAIVDELMR